MAESAPACTRRYSTIGNADSASAKSRCPSASIRASITLTPYASSDGRPNRCWPAHSVVTQPSCSIRHAGPAVVWNGIDGRLTERVTRSRTQQASSTRPLASSATTRVPRRDSSTRRVVSQHPSPPRHEAGATRGCSGGPANRGPTASYGKDAAGIISNP